MTRHNQPTAFNPTIKIAVAIRGPATREQSLAPKNKIPAATPKMVIVAAGPIMARSMFGFLPNLHYDGTQCLDMQP